MTHQDQQFETSGRARRDAPKKGGGVVEYLIILVVSFALVFGFVRPFVVEAFWIPSGSMIPTLQIGDRVLVNEFVYRFTEPERGDIVVFRSVESSDEDLIKRVVGVPGDEIAVRKGKLFLNGEPQKEPYVVEDPCLRYLPKTCSFRPTTVLRRTRVRDGGQPGEVARFSLLRSLAQGELRGRGLPAFLAAGACRAALVSLWERKTSG